jgi:hypothetical protein
MDLNKQQVDTDAGSIDQVDHSVFGRAGTTCCYFKRLDFWLTHHIQRADFVFGCVAWLTEAGILSELAKKHGVCLLVQKEDFLRPDVGQTRRGAMEHIRARYAALPSVSRREFHGLGSQLSTNSGGDEGAVRCVGVRNRNARAAPRMHHKFALFAKKTTQAHEWRSDDFLTCPLGSEPEPGFDFEELRELFFEYVAVDWFVPYAVWTGSFNWTYNAGNSLENAVLLQDPEIVAAYYREFQQVLAFSEPLDWTSDYVEPEWRIGT